MKKILSINETKQKFIEPEKEIEVIDSFDVVVVGGGIAGVSAAIAASRNGVKVCIIEKENCLGGLATLGLVVDYLPLCDGKGHQVVGGLGEELLKKSIKYGPGKIPTCWEKKSSVQERSRNRYELYFNPASFILSLEELVLENNIKLYYDTRFCDVVLKDNKINAVIVENKSGRCAILFKNIVDASGDADVCYKSEENVVSLKNNRKAGWFYSYDNSKIKLHELYDPLYKKLPPHIKTFAGDNWQDITEINIQSRKMILKKVLELRKINKDIYPILIPTIPQLRMTRRLRGNFELDEKDDKKYFKDSIGMTGDWRKLGPIYYIPFRCLIGNKVENLITAGRCISVSNKAWDITRAIPACAVTGEAAGTAAALSIMNNESISEINLITVQRQLIKQNVIIDKKFANMDRV